MNVLPCQDCNFNVVRGQCNYVTDCNEDVSMGRGLYYYWERGNPKPTHRSGGDKNKPMVGYRRNKYWESNLDRERL